ncbi:MAG TPA: hypothetical protein VF989_16345 [Polyangiaceae bacterium]|jgi:hypothetical protein
MKTVVRGFAAVLGMVTVASAARAKPGFPEFGSSGTAALGAERLLGLSFVKVSGDLEGDLTYFHFAGNPSHATPYDIPKLTFDYFVADHVSLGTGFVFGSLDPDGGDAVSIVVFSPRVGVGLAISRRAGVWLRGGLTYYNGEEGDVDGFGLNLDAMFALGITDTFAFTLGPAFDVGLTGSIGPADVRFSSFGLSSGIAGFF